MDEQQSQKRGVRSEAQKEEKARDTYAPIPPANAVGLWRPQTRPTADEDASLAFTNAVRRCQWGAAPLKLLFQL
jgi:hypothetical protein